MHYLYFLDLLELRGLVQYMYDSKGKYFGSYIGVLVYFLYYHGLY